MTTRISSLLLALCFALAQPCLGDGLWHPDSPGTPMSEYLHNVDGVHRTATWADHAGFVLAVDAAGVYDNWRTVDEAPQVLIDLQDTSIDLRDEDFVVTVRTHIASGYGDRFHAGLMVVFSANDVLLWGPHGATDLRLRRPDGANLWQTHDSRTAYLKLKRRGSVFEAWSSADGKTWTMAGSTIIAANPVAVGTMLKTWTTPHAESVAFDHFELTNVQNEPGAYIPNTRYGNFDASALRFVYELSGVEILMRVFVNDDGSLPEPHDTTLYAIHATGDDNGDGCYDALRTYRRIVSILEAGGQPNMVVVAPRFLRNNCPSPGDRHPYGYPLSWGYQNLEGEDDWILLDIHEDYTRTRFPAATAGADEHFYMVGHSGGGQYVTRFAMGHADKLIAAAASSPWGTAYPTGEYEWPFGTYRPLEFREGNPRFEVDLAQARALPLAVILGENDVEPDRGGEAVAVLSRSRRDNAMKWVRQMDSPSVQLYIVPERGHWFSPPKRDIAMAFLFGDPSPWDHLLYSSPTPDFQDEEDYSVFPFEVPEGEVYYFELDRFVRDSRRVGFADKRYMVAPWGSCFEETIVADSPSTYAWVPCSVTHTAGTLILTIGDGLDAEQYGGIWANRLYGKLRLYSTDHQATYMLEESSTATVWFVQDVLVGRRLNLYDCTGRGPDGPECGPFPLGAIQLNGDLTVVDPDTGTTPTFMDLDNYVYDSASKMVRFRDSGGNYLDLQFGDWRWGEDAEGGTFVAGLQTVEEDGVPRRELQTNPIYNPRYFEEWDVATLDYDGDEVTDILDNCPVLANATQADSDGDELGDQCDPTPVSPPPYLEAGEGTRVGEILVNWFAATGATHYRVFRDAGGPATLWLPMTGWQKESSHVDDTATPGHDYTYVVYSAISPSGDGASGPSMTDTGWAALAAPTDVAASDGDFPDAVRITWSSVDGAEAYRVWSSSRDDRLTATILSTWQDATSYDDTSPAPGTTRYYWVQASPHADGGRNSSLGGSDAGWRMEEEEVFADGFEDADDPANQ